MGTEADGVPSYLQPDTESDLDSELNLPSAPTGQAAVPAGRSNAQVNSIEFLQKCRILEFFVELKKIVRKEPLNFMRKFC